MRKTSSKQQIFCDASIALCTKNHFLYVQLLFAAHVVLFRLDKYSLITTADEVDKLSVLCAEDHPWITWTKMYIPLLHT